MANLRMLLLAASSVLTVLVSAGADAKCVKFNAKNGHLTVGTEFKATGRLEANPLYTGDIGANLRKSYGGIGRYAFVLVLDEPILMGGYEVSDNSACEYSKLTVGIATSQSEQDLKASLGRRVEIFGAVSPAQNSDQIIDNGVITLSSMKTIE